MQLVKPSHEILFISPKPLEMIEAAGRTCYKSEDKITEGSAEKFVKMVTKRGHHSVIEHANMTVRFICDLGVTHEIVRHRLAAYSQESTRYCNYKGGVTFIIPPWMGLEEGEWDYVEGVVLPIKKGLKNDEACMLYDRPAYQWFLGALVDCENAYTLLLRNGWSPQQARSVLPNSLKTEIIMTANLREVMHILNLRCSKAAHPQMRELMLPLLAELHSKVPVLFDDLYNKYILT